MNQQKKRDEASAPGLLLFSIGLVAAIYGYWTAKKTKTEEVMGVQIEYEETDYTIAYVGLGVMSCGALLAISVQEGSMDKFTPLSLAKEIADEYNSKIK